MYYFIIVFLSFISALKRSKHGGTVYLDPEPPATHEFTLIFLHGLGDTSSGWLDVFLDDHLMPSTCRVVFPLAPRKGVTVNSGYVMTSWFDIKTLGRTFNNVKDI